MPKYDARCNECGNTKEYYSTVDDCLTAMPDCCGKQMHKVILAAPQALISSYWNFEAYECPVTDKVVTTAKQKREIEIEHDLVIHEPGLVKNAKGKQDVPDLPEPLQKELNKDLAALRQEVEAVEG